MAFASEAAFEEALIKVLSQHGWESEVIRYPTEEDLLRNWADILFQNNNTIDRLNDQPLTDGEMQQIIEQIATLRTPLKLNGYINHGSISVKRDNPNDTLHFGKEISLKIYNRREIAAGQSRYQIVQQPKFKAANHIFPKRRGDLMLLINGMPVFHIELKKSGIPLTEACNQIEKYAAEGVFSGLFALVQVFVAMNPEETLYFANPGPDGKFNKSYFFHWADFDNEPINDWDKLASSLLSIPMAHQLIGFYTVADEADGVLKVMRSYQYYAANKISDTVATMNWDGKHQLGGHIWHTTGSGKTMTSFKSAQLIAGSKDADKVIFLMDRIELGTQSLKEYRAFAESTETVQETEDTVTLIGKLKSTDPADTLIVTSIQKMSNIKEDAARLNGADLEEMQSKRLVFIVDECHRSTFGDMLLTIKQTFPNAVFFGFTGTPIHEENQKKLNTTVSIFGNELHRYSIADGIRDGNVLGFDPYKVMTYKDTDLRRAVALEKAKAATEDEAISDDAKAKVFYHYMDSAAIPMVGYTDNNGTYIKGIEDYIPTAQYETDEHREMVVDDIISNFTRLSRKKKFHAIFATSSIPEAILYYRLFKERCPDMKVAALFEPTIDNSGTMAIEKEKGIAEMLTDYKARYGIEFTIPTYGKYKKDVADRLAHKGVYTRIEKDPDQQLDILIVVDQMLTGFDSKWINTLYLDKLMRYEGIIQAFSRTNRLFNPLEKPFGTIRYYRKPHTMEKNVEAAFNLYSGDRPYGLFVEQLEYNLERICDIYEEIAQLFENAGVSDFTKLPDDSAEKGQFAKLFKELNTHLEAAKIQGFVWGMDYGDPDAEEVTILPDKDTYDALLQRYKELRNPVDPSGTGSDGDDIPYEIDTYLTEIDTGRIDAAYMNSRFKKYMKLLAGSDVDAEELQRTLNELHKSFAALTQEEQKYANIFLHDVQSGDMEYDPEKSFRDYLDEYMVNAQMQEIRNLAAALGVDVQKLSDMMNCAVTEANINEFGRFSDLVSTVDKAKAKAYFEWLEEKPLSILKVNSKASKLLRSFILAGGFEIDLPTEE